MPFIDDDHSKGGGRNIQLLISTKVSSTKSLLDFTGHQKYRTQYRSESQSQVPADQQTAQTSAAQLMQYNTQLLREVCNLHSVLRAYMDDPK
jgi:hypothetical protein